MARSRALSQCRGIQNLAYETAMGFKALAPGDDDIERHARICVALAQIARAWESAVERARILRGRPLPGSLRPERKTKAPRARSARLVSGSWLNHASQAWAFGE
jgi:hypothetical protein